jgi:hypothetical protein
MPRFTSLSLTVLSLVLLASPHAVAADDAGDGGAADATVAVACGGALCDTTNGATCALSPARMRSPAESTAPAVAIASLVAALGIARQMQRRKERG